MSSSTHTIDAKGKRLGRIASEAAKILMGKHVSSYAYEKPGTDIVTIVNASHMLISDRKKKQETYQRYSGYPGGRTVLRMEEIIARKGHKELIRIAVKGMLPRNRLQSGRMKRLTITD